MSLLSPSDIKKQFVQIFDKIQNTTTKDVSYDIYKKLILKSTFNENQMMYIIQQVNDFLLSFTKTPKEKEHALKLLALTFYQPETLSQIEKQNTKIYQYKYIPSILTIIQSLINDSNSNLFQSLSSSFADIIQLILPTDIEVSEIEMEIDEKRIYEMIQNFCFQNMASDDKSTRLMGSMFLTRLVENCPIVLQEHYMQGIWDCIVGYLEKNNFHAKYELLNCLISLILGAEGKFKPFANITLCKVFEFLTDNDWLKRKLALNVIYTIIHYCSEEIYEVKEQLIAFLKLLKGDKVKEVRDICLLILDVLNNKEGEYTVNNNSKNKKSNNNNNNKKGLSSSSSNPNIKQVQYVEKNSNNNVKTKNRKGSLKKNDITIRQNKINKRNINNNNNNNNSKEFILVEKHQETSVTSNVNDISTDNVNITTQKSMESVSIRKRSVTPTRRTMNNVNNDGNCVINDGNELNTSTNRVVHTSGTSLRNNINKVNVNRKEDKTFVNEKMVIKHDPNRSVFKTGKNTAFFNKAKMQPDIVVLDKPKKEDVIMYIGDDDNHNDKDDVVRDDNVNDDNDVNTNDIEIEIKDNNDKKHEEEVNVEKYLIVKQQQNEELKNDVSDNENENDNKILSPTFTNVSDTSNNNNDHNPVKQKVNETTTVYSKKRTNNNINKQPIQQESHNNNNKTEPSQTKNLNNNNNNITSIPNNNNNSNNGYSVELINKLLFQMNSLSSKQLLLLETLDTLQSQTMSEISTLNSNIQSLSSTVSSLSTQLSNYQQSNPKPSQDTTNEAFKHALTSHNEQPLLDLIKQTPMNKYGDVEITYLEKAILKLISTLSNGSNIKLILSFYKNIILCLKCPLKQTTIQNVKEILEYLLQHNDTYYHLNDDFLVDISLLLSNIDDNNK